MDIKRRMSHDVTKEYVDQLKVELLNLKSLCKSKERELEKEIMYMQETCKHKEFIAERNGDYHKPGYYYNCKRCDLFSKSCPAGLIEYK